MKKVQGGMVLFLYLLVGGFIGSVLGEVLSSVIPILKEGISLGLNPPAQLNLWFLGITFGFYIKLNLAGALGMAVALVSWRR